MERDILKGHTDSQRIKQAILNNFSNAEDVLKSEEQVELEALIAKGEIETITPEQIKNEYSGKFYTPQIVNSFNAKIDDLIKKGEESFLEQNEWDYIEKGQADVKALVAKALVITQDGRKMMRKVFVTPQGETITKAEGEGSDEGKLDTSIEKAEGKYGKGKHQQAVTVNRGGKTFTRQQTVGTKEKLTAEQHLEKHKFHSKEADKLAKLATKDKEGSGGMNKMMEHAEKARYHKKQYDKLSSKTTSAKKDDWDEPVRDTKKYVEHKEAEAAPKALSKTKSGKSIYENFDLTKQGDFTANDHKEAHAFHMAKSKEAKKDRDVSLFNHHTKQALKHITEASRINEKGDIGKVNTSNSIRGK